MGYRRPPSISSAAASVEAVIGRSRISSMVNQPSAAAGEGGYGVDARSSRCALVPAVDGPSDFEDGVEPAPARRGAIKLCSGCL